MEKKVVLITGAGRGLGFATAQKFAENGYRVAICDLNESLVKDATQTLLEAGYEARGYQVDVTNLEMVSNLFRQVKQTLGRFDVLVNNAGVQIRNDAVDFLEDDWDVLMDVNLKAVFFCAREAAKIMKESGGGTIVNLSSGTSSRTTPGRAPYNISKAGVNSLTAVLACEWAKYNIRVNAVAPGWIMTNMLQDGFRLGVVSNEQLMAAIPMKRYAKESEIADAVYYLSSQEASYITGQTLFVDGGQTALGLPDVSELI